MNSRMVEAMKVGAGDFAVSRTLAESERRLRTIIATEPECVKVVSADGRLLEMNPAGLAMLEAGSLDEALARPLLEYLLPEHRAAFTALHQRVIRGESGTLEFEVIGLKGGRRWLETHAVPLPGADGEAATLLGITRDVTAHKLAERRLRESEERFRSLTKLSSDWYWEQDVSFRFTVMSGGLVNKGNFSISKALGKTRWELPIELSAIEWTAHRATLEAHRAFTDFEYKIATDDGSMRYYSARGEPIFDNQGRFEGYRGTANDITERKLSEYELQQFRMAMDVSTDSVYLTDLATLRFVYLNNAVCQRLGYTREQLLQMGPHDVLSADRAQISREFDEVIAAGDGGMSKEHRFVTSSGGEGWTELHRRALRVGEGTLIVTIGRDITERKLADDRIRRLSRIHAVLSGINSTIVRVRDRAELFREVCRIATEAGEFPMAYVGAADPAEQRLIPLGLEGAAAAFMTSVASRLSLRDDAPEGYGPSATAIREKRVVVINDVETDPRIRFKKEHVEHGIRSIASLPLLVAGEPARVLVLHSSEPGFFDREEMKLLTELAGDISFALEHIANTEKLDFLALYDSLTGLANRTLFHERLDQHVRSANQRQAKLALVLLNVERFKSINDSLGRQAGDELLRQLAERLAGAAEQANVARIGGDQFAIVLPEVKGRSEVAREVERIWRACFAQPFSINGTEMLISAKSGIALHPIDGVDSETLFTNAEAALFRARDAGERHQFHSRDLSRDVVSQFALENQLRRALERDEFVLHYQPKVDLETRTVVGVEALIRWQSPELGLVPPMKFIPLMEETGLILEAGTWALRRAAMDHRKWFELGLEAPRVAVNLSPIQLRQRNFVETVKQAIIEGIAPVGIDLEITESLIMEDVLGGIEKLKAVRELGVSIAIDDFGTGYSSLGYLAKLPVQTLKIDRSFIITMLKDADTMTLVSTIISLAHSLRLKVVAEGVEEEEQAKVLRLLRCDQMQGYLFSKPVPFEAMTTLLRQEKKT